MDSKYGSPMVKDGAIGNAKMFQYTLTASFVTERELSEEELGALILQVAPQIEEPVNAEGDSVDYEIKLITCEISSLLIKEVE